MLRFIKIILCAFMFPNMLETYLKQDFKADRKQVSLEEQIVELKAIIESYKSKSFWQRILKND